MIQSNLDPDAMLKDIKNYGLQISDVIKGQPHMVRGKNWSQIHTVGSLC